MNRSAKVGLVAAGIATTITLGALTSRFLYKDRHPLPPISKSEIPQEDPNILDLVDSIEENFQAASELYQNPSLETAIRANRASKNALQLMQLYILVSGDSRSILLLDYIRGSIKCLEGLELVKGHDKYINHYTECTKYRIEIARALMDPKNGYQDRAGEVVSAMMENLINPDYKTKINEGK